MDIEILLALQNFREGAGAFLTEFLQKMTFLGELTTVLVIMAIIYWSVDKELGTYLLMGWSGNRLVNGMLKITVCAYRPWIRDARIVPYGNSMTTATGYSFPSGHTMNASTVYGGITVRNDKPAALRVLLVFVVLLVGFSRLFLGVHTPQDVLVGMAAGLPVMWLVFKMMKWVDNHPGKDWIIVVIGLLLATALGFYAALKQYPADYDAAGKLLVDGKKMANDTYKGIGWCMAFLTGWILERRFVRFSTDVSATRKLTRAAFGLIFFYAVTLILVPQIKAMLPGPTGTIVSCFFQMFYVAFLFPWCIKHFEKESETNHNPKNSRVLPVIILLLAAAIAAFALFRQQQELSAQKENLTQETEPVQADTVSVEGIDYALVFPSWNPDSTSLKELVDFVSESTDESNPNYIEPADRIAAFDMDGTILCEKAPVYIDYCLTMYRVLDDPTYHATEEERDAMQQIRDHAYTNGETFHPEGLTKHDLVASAFAGMTPEEFRAYTVNFADSVNAVGFEGMTYGQSFYKPMIEVIDYLRDNGYDVWMVSACEREVVRALVERYGIPYDHVVATDVPYVASGKGTETAADEYNMSKDEIILLGAPLDDVECGQSGKAAAIAREIGKRPVLAFGNSAGDYSMLNYAEGNPEHTGKGFFVVCDDNEREYGNDVKAAKYYQEVETQGWTAISMADDWTTIYGEGVQKTELPGAEEETLQNAA